MKFAGNIDMGNNTISNVVVTDEGFLPSDAKKGRLAFNNKRLYVCIDIINLIPIWIPLTSEVNTAQLIVTVPSITWVFPHNLNSPNPVIQIYDDNHQMVQPDSISITNNNTVTITFAQAISGTAVGIFGDMHGTPKMATAYETTIPVNVPVLNTVVQHNLGYNPTVTVVQDGVVIYPKSIVHQSIYSTYVEFTNPTSGILRFT
jgi:hypothetical protein